jgi:pilus assembly protein CpaE
VSLDGVKTLVLLGEGIEADQIRPALPAATPVRVMTLAEATEQGPDVVEQLGVDLMIIGSAAYSEPALRIIASVAARHPDCPIAVLYAGTPNGFMESAFEAGADDLIRLPQRTDDLAFALEKIIAKRRSPSEATANARMVAVLGPKGGTGKTLITCNLAVAFALKGLRTVVVDMDLQFGDVGLALGLRPGQTIYDLAISAGSLDGDKVDNFLVEHPSGARVLLAPSRPDQAAAIEVPFLRKLFDILRSGYDVVIVDTSPAFTAEVIATIDSATDLLIIGMLDALSLKDTKIGLETLAQMGYQPNEVRFVLNRADSSVGIAHEDVEQLLGRRADIFVPSDRAIPRAITEGRTIIEAEPRSGAAQALSALADLYLQERKTAVPAGSADIEQPARTGLRRTLLRKGT